MLEEPSTIAQLVVEVRRAFISQLAAHGAYAGEDSAALAAFNNAIVPLVALIEESCDALRQTADDNARARAELAQLRSLARRKTFGAADPVCPRCIAVRVEADEPVHGIPAKPGEVCSACGAYVLVRRDNETDAQFRARIRNNEP